ncbi:MAG: hypothetical protein M5R40_29580 [Anaerolineae bacterium]|nr:hypothetical protein [Anaerolineae bacterium]
MRSPPRRPKSGVFARLIGEFERDAKLPSRQQLLALAWALGETPEALLRRVAPSQALYRRFSDMVALEVCGEFSLGVELFVAGESREQIVRALCAYLDRAKKRLVEHPVWEPLPTTIQIDHEVEEAGSAAAPQGNAVPAGNGAV